MLKLKYKKDKKGVKMKNKGFTIIELLVIAVIFALILIITIPVFTKKTDGAKISLYKEQINRILAATKSWEIENEKKLPEKSNWNLVKGKKENFDYSTLKNIDVISFTVNNLKRTGYLKNEDIKNPIDKNSNLEGTIAIYYNSHNKQYVELYCYNEKEYDEYGHYYYTKKQYDNEVKPLCKISRTIEN